MPNEEAVQEAIRNAYRKLFIVWKENFLRGEYIRDPEPLDTSWDNYWRLRMRTLAKELNIDLPEGV